jgi:hypothetical protein
MTMKFAMRITAYVEAKDEKEAQAIIKKTDHLLGQTMTKMVFKSQGVPLVGHEVDPEPAPT